MLEEISHLLAPDQKYLTREHYYEFEIANRSKEIEANAKYFDHVDWAKEYLDYCHRSPSFVDRWQSALGDWNGKIVIDIGCGPGNIYASLAGKPQHLIGIDVAPASLKLAYDLGYTTILADAHNLPLLSDVADVVTLNATLHHCQHMDIVLKEAGRLVKPGGLLITDHDPQYSAWNYKGPARLLWNARLLLYALIGRGFHKSAEQQRCALESEIHHKPGHGVSHDLFHKALDSNKFEVKIFPHNHTLGADVFNGKMGKAGFQYRLGNILSGRHPNAEKAALSLMCVARKLN